MLAATFTLACSVGAGDPFPGSVSVGSAGSPTTGPGSDASGDDSTGAADSASTGVDATTDATAVSASDASSDDGTSAGDATDAGDATSLDESSTGATGATGGDPLDPDLDIPNGGEECTTPGDLNECPGIAVCRFATTEHGLCESCDACGNLNAPCVEGTDCDILFSCYAGRCTNFCTLGTFECGPIEDCLDIGHPTRGVCDPFA